MSRLFKLSVVIVAVTLFSGCAQMDEPSVSFSESSYMIPATGGELIIPVRSTGVDDVRIEYNDMSNWEVDSNGDMIPVEGWMTIVKVIDNYQTTRELAEWMSGIVIDVKPNNNNSERSAVIVVKSYTAESSLRISQPALLVK